jgi:hypothetical protein
VASENRTLGQFEALRSGVTPLVGCEEEIELLLCRWAQAKPGIGRVVLISAERGGSPALPRHWPSGSPPNRTRGCAIFVRRIHQDNALCPVIAQMERAAGFAHGDAPAARFAKLRALLAATGPPMEDVALIAELHSRPSVDLAPLLDVTSQRKREKTFEALLQQVEGFGQPRPVLMLFDCCSMTSIGSTRVRGNCWTA